MLYQPNKDETTTPPRGYDVLHSVINSCSSRIASAREKQLIERLKECGFEFETREELERFAETRCRVEIMHDKFNRLMVDDMIIAEWWDTVEITNDGNRVTMIAGKPPAIIL